MKRTLIALGLLVGAALAVPSPEEVSAQARPTATPTRPATTTSTAPRAGGFPVELALPLLGGGSAALGFGAYLLRRKK